MLSLDFINVGNGDAALVRQLDRGETQFAMLVDCGHDCLQRDDHPALNDPRSCRIFAGEFLRKLGVRQLDLLVLTHFHRDHVGGLGRVLDAVQVRELAATYFPPDGAVPLEPDRDMRFPKAARNVLRCMEMFRSDLARYPERVERRTCLSGSDTVCLHPTDELTMELRFGDAGLYLRQRQVYDAAFRGERNAYDLIRWGKCLNISSLRMRLFYHDRQVVLGGDAYAAMWETESVTPCDILKVPHHGSISSMNRKFLDLMRPKTAVVSVAAGRPDERPHPYMISLLREYTQDIHFTDAVSIPGLVEPVYHEAVHMEIP